MATAMYNVCVQCVFTLTHQDWIKTKVLSLGSELSCGTRFIMKPFISSRELLKNISTITVTSGWFCKLTKFTGRLREGDGCWQEMTWSHGSLLATGLTHFLIAYNYIIMSSDMATLKIPLKFWGALFQLAQNCPCPRPLYLSFGSIFLFSLWK